MTTTDEWEVKLRPQTKFDTALFETWDEQDRADRRALRERVDAVREQLDQLANELDAISTELTDAEDARIATT